MSRRGTAPASPITDSIYALQHRGQEACGIAAIDNWESSVHKNVELGGEVFSPHTLKKPNGTMAVGHVRYSTTGGARRENAQSLTLKYVRETLNLAHNGNLPHADEVHTRFEYQGAIFQTTSDSELIAYAIAQARLHCPSVEEAVCWAPEGLQGAWALIIMSPRKLVTARDPWGSRPLYMGRRGEAVVFASESYALDVVGARLERDLDPEEIVVVEGGAVNTDRKPIGKKGRLCIFEYICFARPSAQLCGEQAGGDDRRFHRPRHHLPTDCQPAAGGGSKRSSPAFFSPPFVSPCYFGSDITNKKELITCCYSVEEIRKQIGADTLGFFEPGCPAQDRTRCRLRVLRQVLYRRLSDQCAEGNTAHKGDDPNADPDHAGSERGYWSGENPEKIA